MKKDLEEDIERTPTYYFEQAILNLESIGTILAVMSRDIKQKLDEQNEILKENAKH